MTETGIAPSVDQARHGNSVDGRRQRTGNDVVDAEPSGSSQFFGGVIRVRTAQIVELGIHEWEEKCDSGGNLAGPVDIGPRRDVGRICRLVGPAQEPNMAALARAAVDGSGRAGFADGCIHEHRVLTEGRL